MVKMSKQEIEQQIDLETGRNDDFFGADTPEVNRYIHRVKPKNAPNLESQESQPPRILNLISKNGKPYQAHVLEYDDKHKIARVRVSNKRGIQFFDMSKSEPRLILVASTAQRYNTEYKDGCFVSVDYDRSKQVWALDSKNTPQPIAQFGEKETVCLFEDGVFTATGEKDKLLGVYNVKDGKANWLLTTQANYNSLNYDSDEKVLAIGKPHSFSEDHSEYIKTTEYFRITDKASYMGKNTEKSSEDDFHDDDDYYAPDFEFAIGQYEIYKDRDFQKDQWNNTYNSHVRIHDTKTNKWYNTYTCRTNDMDIEQKDGNIVIKDRDIGKIITMSPAAKPYEYLSSEEMSPQERFANRYGIKTKYGTFYNGDGYQCGDFVSNQNKVIHVGGCIDDRQYAGSLTNNGLMNIGYNDFDLHRGFSNGSYVYDFKNDCRRDDLEAVIDLGYDFFAAKKKGETKYGVYEIADEEMKIPLMQVDKIKLSVPQHYKGAAKDNTNFIDYEIDGSICKAELMPEGKIAPLMKLKDNKLSVSGGGEWISMKLDKNIEVDFTEGKDIIGLTKYSEPVASGTGTRRNYLARETLDYQKLLKLAKLQAKDSQRERVEKIREGYLNRKERLQANRQTKLSSEDILKSRMAKRLSADM